MLAGAALAAVALAAWLRGSKLRDDPMRWLAWLPGIRPWLQLLTPAGDTAASAVAVDALIDAVAAIGVADLEARLGRPDPASARQ
mgnify:CR=1 FL=1